MKSFLLTLVVFFTCTLITFAQWTDLGVQLTGLNGGAVRISVVDSNVVWVAGGIGINPKVYRTVDGGLTWDTLSTTGLPYFLTCIAAKDTVTAFVADVGSSSGTGGNAKLFKTTNAGLSWTIIDSTGGTLGFYNDIQFSKSNPQFGIAMSDPADGLGGPFIVNKTTNGGDTWVKTNPPGVPNSFGLYYTAYAIDPQFYGFAVWDNATEMFSYTTTDGGNTWSLGDSAVATINWGDIVFNDDKQHGVMVGYEWPDIKITSNGGVNWVTVNTGTDIHGFSTARWISGTDVVFICAHISSTDRKIIRSDNNGITWQQQNTPPYMAVRELDFVRYGNGIIGYAITTDGHVLKSAQTVNLSIYQDTLYVPSEYPTIQSAIDAAINGDLVLVADGLYYENINYLGKAITVASHFLIDGDTAHISNTIINGSQPSFPDSGSVVSFKSGEDTMSVICGFTITGGTGTYSSNWNEFEGGGIFCTGSGAKIINNMITGNEAIYSVWAAGGGIYMDFEETQRWIIIENNVISDNYVESGNGIASGGGIFAGNNARIIGNTIENNTCYNATQQHYLYGGGIGIDGASAWTHTIYCSNNVIQNNSLKGGYYSGGAGIWMDNGNFYINQNEINNNNLEQASAEQGAGLLISDPDDECIIKGNKFSSNTGEGISDGGGVCILNGPATLIRVDGNILKDNEGGEGGGLFLYNTFNMGILNNLFIGNNAASGGGGINFSAVSIESKKNDDQYGKIGRQSARIHPEEILDTQPFIINNTFYGNNSVGGGAIYNDAATGLVIINTIFWDNEAVTGKDLYQYSSPAMQVHYSDIETDSISGNWSGDNNIYADPLFEDPNNDDFHLLDSSHCIGGGIDSLELSGTVYYSPPYCFFGTPRPNPANTMPDIGACESPSGYPVGIADDLMEVPKHYSLFQNYPNPFNPVTTIKFQIPSPSLVTLKVYDVLGREVKILINEVMTAGRYETEFDAGELSSGVYFYKLQTLPVGRQAGNFVQVKKMILIK